MSTVDQPGLTPTTKITAAGAGGAAGLILVFIAGQFGLDISPEVAAAVTTLVAFVAGYFKRERAEGTTFHPGDRGLTLLETLVVLLVLGLVVLAVIVLT